MGWLLLFCFVFWLMIEVEKLISNHPFECLVAVTIIIGLLLLWFIISYVRMHIVAHRIGGRNPQKGYAVTITALLLAICIANDLNKYPAWAEMEQQKYEAKHQAMLAARVEAERKKEKQRQQEYEREKRKFEQEMYELRREAEHSSRRKSSNYYYGEYFCDPDDYDSYEDYMDDAWGYDFEDWDEADSFWENW